MRHRKEQILQAATQVFVSKGLDAARMEEIAQEAGLSVGGVYWYFKSKEAIVHALLQEMFDADFRGLREAVAAHGTVHARLAAYAATRWRRRRNNRLSATNCTALPRATMPPARICWPILANFSACWRR